MAEPDWTLIQTTLQQLQADNAEFKTMFGQILAELSAMREKQLDVSEEVTYALGMIVATQRDVNRAKARMDEIVARIEKVEVR